MNPRFQDSERLLSSGDVAAALGVSVATARQWLRRCGLDSSRTPGGHRRVRASDVVAQCEAMRWPVQAWQPTGLQPKAGAFTESAPRSKASRHRALARERRAQGFNALLTTVEVAAALGVERCTVAQWCNAGELSATRTPGGHRRIRRAELERFCRRTGMKEAAALLPSAAESASLRVTLVTRGGMLKGD